MLFEIRIERIGLSFEAFIKKLERRISFCRMELSNGLATEKDMVLSSKKKVTIYSYTIQQLTCQDSELSQKATGFHLRLKWARKDRRQRMLKKYNNMFTHHS